MKSSTGLDKSQIPTVTPNVETSGKVVRVFLQKALKSLSVLAKIQNALTSRVSRVLQSSFDGVDAKQLNPEQCSKRTSVKLVHYKVVHPLNSGIKVVHFALRLSTKVVYRPNVKIKLVHSKVVHRPKSRIKVVHLQH